MAEEVGMVVVFKGDADSVEKASVDAAKSVTKISTSAARANKALEGLSKKSGQAGAAILNTGRVIQDLPFAFNNFGSIANNLDPLFESFTRLRASAKETGQSVGKSLFESLKGGAGIGLAISAVTAGITIWQMYGDKIKRALGFTEDIGKGSGEALKKSREALDKYVDSLNDVSRARVRGTQDAQEELIRVQFLYAATQNHTLSLKERNKAVDELQKQYPSYFGNLSNEAILAGQAGVAYNKLRDSILAAARARSAMKELEELASQMRVIEDQQAKALQKESDAFQEREKLNKAEESRRKNAAKDYRLENVALNNIINAERIRWDAIKEGNALEKQRQELLERSKRLTEDITGIVQDAGVDALTGAKVKVPKVKTPKENFEFFNKFFGFNPDGSLSPKQQASLMDAANNFAKEFTTIFEGLNFHPTGSNKSALELAKAFWADYQKGIVTFKPDAFLNIDLSKDVPEVKFPDKRDLQAAFNESMKQAIGEKGPRVDTSIEVDAKTQFKDPAILKAANEAGRRIGDSVGVGFGDALGKRFSAAVSRALDQKMDSKALAEFQSKLQVSTSIAAQSFTALGDAASAMTTAFFEGGNAMQAFGQSLINSFKQLAAQLVKNIVLAGILSAISGGSTSFLSALGGLMGGGKIPGFAAGGIVSGPTLAMIGEGAGTSRRNPEIIAPLDKLKDFIGSGGGTVVVMGKIKGNDILLSNARTGKKNRRGG